MSGLRSAPHTWLPGITAVAYIKLTWLAEPLREEKLGSSLLTPFLYVLSDKAIKQPIMGVKRGFLGSGLIW